VVSSLVTGHVVVLKKRSLDHLAQSGELKMRKRLLKEMCTSSVGYEIDVINVI